MPELVNYQTINGKYRIVIERAASTKGVDGFKVEANGDSIQEVEADANHLYLTAQELTAIKKEVE
jgi:hypothetical protein